MPFDIGTLPAGVEKLSPDAQLAWVNTANEAIENGYDDAAASAIAWTVAKKIDAEEFVNVLYDYPAWRPGKYNAAMGGEFEVEPPDVEQMTQAVNKLFYLGHPVAMIDGHGSGSAVGTMPAARVENDIMRAAIVGQWWAINGIKDGVYGLSVEANRDYASDAYTGGETFKYWPTAWAVLPAGEQPAIPPGEPLAASAEKQKPVRLYAHETAPDGGGSPNERGQDIMTLEELTAKVTELEASQGVNTEKISALETENGELKAKLTAAEEERDQLKADKEADEVKAAEKAVEDRSKNILAAEQRPGVREKMEGKLAAAEGVTAKTVLLDAWEGLMDDAELAQAKLQASESKPVDTNPDDKYIKAAEARAKKDSISFLRALDLVVADEQEG